MPETFTVFGDRVRWARHLRGLLAREVVDSLPVSSPTYSRIENSDMTEVDPVVAHSLALALSTPLGWLSAPPEPSPPQAGRSSVQTAE